MTTTEAAKRIGIGSIVLARYCRTGKIQASFTAKGRTQRKWNISEEALQHYLEARKGCTRSSLATRSWAQRRRLDFSRNQRSNDSHFPSYDDVETHDHRQAAFNGQREAIETLKEHGHVTWWWNRAKGVIVGTVDLDEIQRYAEQMWAKRPTGDGYGDSYGSGA